MFKQILKDLLATLPSVSDIGGIKMNKLQSKEEQELENKMYREIKELIESSRKRAFIAVNTTLLDLYWHIGENIVNNLQKGKKKAKYGTNLINNISKKLTVDYGKNFSMESLRRMRRFYLLFPIRSAVQTELSWSHYRELLQIKDEHIRNFYIQECINSRWGYRELGRMIKSKLYERLLTSSDNNKLAVQGNVISTSKDLIKDPYILEFLNLNDNYKEKDLEKEIINHLKEFLLELGKGFMYVGSEVKIKIDKRNYYPDLVFYNNILNCYVIIELKIGEVTHKDIGQINMYVNYYDKNIKKDSDNPTVGILLAKDKNKTIVKYAIPNNEQIYASKYLLHLPSKEELEKELQSIEEEL